MGWQDGSCVKWLSPRCHPSHGSSFPNNSTKWGPSIPIYEPMGAILIQNMRERTRKGDRTHFIASVFCPYHIPGWLLGAVAEGGLFSFTLPTHSQPSLVMCLQIHPELCFEFSRQPLEHSNWHLKPTIMINNHLGETAGAPLDGVVRSCNNLLLGSASACSPGWSGSS